MSKRENASSFGQNFHRSNSTVFRPLLWLFGILLGLLILAKLLSLALSLNQPIGITSASARPYNWDSKSAVNLLFVSLNSEAETKQSVVNFNPKQNKITILDISPQTYLDLPKGYGSWKIGSVYKLGQEETPPSGSKLLEQSVSKLISLPIDGIVVFNGSTPSSSEEFVTRLRKNRLNILSSLSKLNTDLTTLQIIKLFWQLSEVRADKIISLDFLQSNVTESKLLADSSRVLGVNTVKLDLFIRKNLADSNILEEGKSIAVFNGTSHPGLTAQVSRVITNLGGNVIIASNAENMLATSQVSFSESSLTALRLAQIYAPNCLPAGCLTNDPKLKVSRAQINIILGEDYYKSWYER